MSNATRRHKKSETATWLLLLLPVLLYLFDLPDLPLRGPGGRSGVWFQAVAMMSQISAIGGITALSVAFILASRHHLLEKMFGGLDKMYRTHHRLGLAAFFLILAHPLFFAGRFLPDRLDRFFEVWLPIHKELAVNIGVFSFWLMALLIAASVIRFIPYNWWRQSHRLMGFVLLGPDGTCSRFLKVRANRWLIWLIRSCRSI